MLVTQGAGKRSEDDENTILQFRRLEDECRRLKEVKKKLGEELSGLRVESEQVQRAKAELEERTVELQRIATSIAADEVEAEKKLEALAKLAEQITAEKATAEFDQSEFVRANREQRRRLQAGTREMCHLSVELNAALRNFSEKCDDSVSQLRQAYANLAKKLQETQALLHTQFEDEAAKEEQVDQVEAGSTANLHEMDHEEAAGELEQLEADQDASTTNLHEMDHEELQQEAADELEQLEADQDVDMGSEHGHIRSNFCSDECQSTWKIAQKYLQDHEEGAYNQAAIAKSEVLAAQKAWHGCSVCNWECQCGPCAEWRRRIEAATIR